MQDYIEDLLDINHAHLESEAEEAGDDYFDV